MPTLNPPAGSPVRCAEPCSVCGRSVALDEIERDGAGGWRHVGPCASRIDSGTRVDIAARIASYVQMWRSQKGRPFTADERERYAYALTVRAAECFGVAAFELRPVERAEIGTMIEEALGR